MYIRLFAAMFCAVLIFVSSVDAQFVQDPQDAGAADSIDMRFSVIPDATTNKLQVQMDLYFFNDVQSLASASVGFEWDNPNLQMDSAAFSDEAATAFSYLQFLFRSGNIATTNTYQQFQFSGSKLFGDGLVASSNPKLAASYYFTLSSWDVSDTILVDTVAFSGGTNMKFVTNDLAQYVPYFGGLQVIRDTAVVIPSNLVFSEDTLYFSAIEGEGSPTAQAVQITSDYAPLSFSLTEDIPWLLKSPVLATTPANILISVATAGLAVGTYFDSVLVESEGAENSPRYIFVELNILAPPPVIGVNFDVFYFSAIVDSTNPPIQTLLITNIGGSESSLDWTLTNSQSWLALSPLLGTDSGFVTLEVDITGLLTGSYVDTIVVVDANAPNSPVSVVARLEIGTDLPLLDVDSLIYSTVLVAEKSEYLRTFGVRNGGAGDLDFWLEPHSRHIVYLRPDSGSAPDSVDVLFQNDDVIPDGREWSDTLWVYSAQAINSPVMVIFNFLLVVNHPELVLSMDTLQIDIYDCDQGYGRDLPRESFQVTNGNGVDQLSMSLEYESDFFTINQDRGTTPDIFSIVGVRTGLPVGSYYDTISVVSKWASNSPQQLIVQYNVVPGDQPAQIVVTKTEFSFIVREGDTAWSDTTLEIHNLQGGCMPWQIIGEVGWLVPSEITGDVPAALDFLINPTEYLLGEYVDSLQVISPTAINSPQKISGLLKVWRLYGDMNWDGILDIGDITMLIRHLFLLGEAARPLPIIGDTDCNGLVDIGDLTALIRSLWITQQPLCGNPN